MKELFAIIAQMTLDLPPDRIRLAAKKIAQLPTRGVKSDVAIASWGPTLAKTAMVKQFGDLVSRSGLSPDELASALFGAVATAELHQKRSTVDILWTGPQTKSVPVRRVEQALCELVDLATERIFVVSFVAYKAEKVYKAVRAAIDRGVKVSFLTESSKEHGGSLDADPVAELKKKFPEADYYRWEPEAGKSAVVHAKCAIADQRMALVTSANLTGAAMDNNMELGLLVAGTDVAARLSSHFAALITENIIKKV